MGEPINPNSFLDTTRLHRWLSYSAPLALFAKYGVETTYEYRDVTLPANKVWATAKNDCPGTPQNGIAGACNQTGTSGVLNVGSGSLHGAEVARLIFC